MLKVLFSRSQFFDRIMDKQSDGKRKYLKKISFKSAIKLNFSFLSGVNIIKLFVQLSFK
jgi:hypothetical protein